MQKKIFLVLTLVTSIGLFNAMSWAQSETLPPEFSNVQIEDFSNIGNHVDGILKTEYREADHYDKIYKLENGTDVTVSAIGLPVELRNWQDLLTPYTKTVDDNSVSVSTGQISFTFDRNNCAVTMYDGKRIDGGLAPIIKSNSYIVRYAVNGTNNWIPINEINGAQCNTEIFEDGNSIEVRGTKFVQNIGELKIRYLKLYHDGLKPQIEFKNLNPNWNNHKFSIIGTDHVPDEIVVGEEKIKIKEKQPKMSRNDLELEKGESLNIKIGKLEYESLSGGDQLWSVNTVYENGITKLVTDYSNQDGKIYLPGETLVLDPIYLVSTSTKKSVTSTTSAGSTCSTTASSNSASLIVDEAAYNVTGSCSVATVSAPISSLPDFASYSNIDINYNFNSTITSPKSCNFVKIGIDPSAATNQEIYDAVRTSTVEYNTSINDCKTSGEKITNLGSIGLQNFENAIQNRQSKFTVGIIHDDMSRTSPAAKLITSQDTSPEGLTFKSDGTKMYMAGDTNNAIFQYSLSTAWNVSTATYDNLSKNISTEETSLQEVVFKPDGTKMYIIGSGSDTVFQYSLSTAWNVSTASYDSISKNISTENGTPTGLAFKPDGTKMYMFGTTAIIYQYSLSTAWNVSSAVYDGIASTTSFSGGEQFVFKPDGTKLWMTTSGTDLIREYLLPTPWDVAVLTASNTLLVTAQEGSGSSLFYNSDGTSLYHVGTATDTVYQYNSNVPWDLASTSYGGQHLQSSATNAIANIIVTYTLPTPTAPTIALTVDEAATKTLATTVNSTTSVGSIQGYYWNRLNDNATFTAKCNEPFDGSCQGLVSRFSLDGAATGLSDMVIGNITVGSGVAAGNTTVGTGGGSVLNTDLVAKYDFDNDNLFFNQTSSGSFVKMYNTLDELSRKSTYLSLFAELQDTTPVDVFFKSDGTKMYVVGFANDSVYQYTLSTAWNVSTATYDNLSKSVTTQDTTPQDVFFKDDGTRMYVVGQTNDSVYQYLLSTAWDVSTATYNLSKSVTAQDTAPRSVSFKDDGTKMYVLGQTSDTVYQYSLSTAWNVSTATYDSISKSVTAQDATPENIFFKSDGTKMFVLGSFNDFIYQYTLSTPWVVNTATYDSISFNVLPENANPFGLFFRSDGAKMYMIGDTNDSVYQYSLLTTWTISTAFYDSFFENSVQWQDTVQQSFFFKPDGTKMYTLGGADSVYQYSLLTAWDVRTVIYDNLSKSVTAQDSVPTDVFFKDDGTKMYMLGVTTDTVYQYTLSTPWNVSTATYDSLFKSVTTQDDTPQGIFFKPDGTKMYMGGSFTDSVYQYSLSTAWNVSTATYDSISFGISQDTTPTDIFFKSDGTKVYMVGNTGNSIYQYSSPTPWVLSGTVYNSIFLNVTAQESTPSSIFFSPDSTDMYMVGITDNKIFQYIDSPFIPSIIVGSEHNSGSILKNNMFNSIELSLKRTGSPTGTAIVGVWDSTVNSTIPIFICDKININTITTSVANYNVNCEDTYTITNDDLIGIGLDSVVISNSLNYIEVNTVTPSAFDTTNTHLHRYNGTSWESPAQTTYDLKYSLNSLVVNKANPTYEDYTKTYTDTFVTDGWVDADSSKIGVNTTLSRLNFVAERDNTNDKSYYDLGDTLSGTDWTLRFKYNVTGATAGNSATPLPIFIGISSGTGGSNVAQNVVYLEQSAVSSLQQLYGNDIVGNSSITRSIGFDFSQQDTATNGLFFKPDGTKMYMVGATNDSVYQYSLSTAWNVSTATYDNLSKSVLAQDGLPTAISFKSDGTKMYVVGDGNNRIYQYILSIPWNVSTATYDSYFSNAVQDSASRSLVFESNGNYMYVTGSTGFVFKYSLSTPWDITTAYYEPVQYIGGEDISIFGVFFKPDGTKMYMVGSTGDSVYQYSLSTAWNVSTATYDNLSKSVTSQDTVPIGLFFKDDGTKMYIVGSTNKSVYQYSLSTAWNVSTATYDNLSKSVTSQDTSPQDIFFKSDGTKMYMVGSTGDSVYQYSLSTAWNVSTATYDNLSKSVSAQDTVPQGVFFKDDGTKMYIVGQQFDKIYQYSLSTVWNVSTATYDSISFGITAQDATPTGVFFKPDGTKIYTTGSTNDSVFQYSLSTAWNINIVFYDNLSKGLGGQDTTVVGLIFKPDGTKMYVLGQTGDSVYQYSLSTAWNVSTATYDNLSKSVTSQDTVPQDIFFKSDGTKMYMVGSTGDSVYQYSLSTAWNVSTATYDNLSKSVTSQDISPTAVSFKSDGTKMYVVGDNTDSVYQYSLSTAWNVSTATYDSISFSVTTEELIPSSIFFKSDGTSMYIIGPNTDRVRHYSLSTPWNVSTATIILGSAFYGIGQENAPNSIFFKDDGTKMYLVGTDDVVYQYSLNIGWDVSTTTYGGKMISVVVDASGTGDSVFDSNGMLYTVSSDNYIYKHVFSTGFDFNTIIDVQKKTNLNFNTPTSITMNSPYIHIIDTDVVHVYSMINDDFNTMKNIEEVFDTGNEDAFPITVFFKPDGTKMYVLGGAGSNDSVYQYSLSTAWNVSTATYDNLSKIMIPQDSQPLGLFFKPDGTKMYMVGATNDSVYQYSLSTAWNVSTATYDNLSKSVTSQDTSPQDIFFKSDGTKMYMVGSTGDSVYQYSLSTAWNVSTATYDNLSKSVTSQDISPVGLFFKDEGTKMYIVGQTGDAVYQYSLSTAWNVSTVVYDTLLMSTVPENSVSDGMFFKSDGTKMYIVGEFIYTYNISDPWMFTQTITPNVGTLFSFTPVVTTYYIDMERVNQTNIVMSLYSDSNYINLIESKTISVIQELDGLRYLSAFNYVNAPSGENHTLNGYIDDVQVYDGLSWAPIDIDAVATNGTAYYELSHSIPADRSFDLDGVNDYFNTGNPFGFMNDVNTTWAFSGWVKPDVCNINQTLVSNADNLSTGDDGVNIKLTNTCQLEAGFMNNGAGTRFATTSTITTTQWHHVAAVYNDVANSMKLFVNGVLQSFTDSGTRSGTEEHNLYIGKTGSSTHPLNGQIDDFVIYKRDISDQEVITLSETFPKNTGKLQPTTTPYLFYEFDTNTTSYDNKYMSVIGTLGDIFFKSDGTKVYIVEYGGDAVHQYSLSTAWDVSTGTYDNISKSISAQESVGLSLFFKPDGTKMYVGGSSGSIYQYSLSTPWNVSTATYDNLSKSVSAQDTLPGRSLFFKPDGTKMYMAGQTNTSIYQYSLSTAWNVSTATYDSISFSTTAVDNAPEGMFFKSDGKKLYVATNNNDLVIKYDLPTPWVLTGATFINSHSVSSESTSISGVFFKSDGTKMYTLMDKVNQYTLGTLWELGISDNGATIQNLGVVPDLTEDFNTDEWTDQGTLVAVDTTGQTIDWNAGQDDDTTVYDLGADNTCDTTCVLRFKLTIDTLTVTASAVEALLHIGISDTGVTGQGADTQDFVGMYINAHSTSTKLWGVSNADGENLGQAGDTERTNFVQSLDVGTYYIELVRSEEAIIGTIYNDSSFSNKTDSVIYAGTNVPTGLRYLKVTQWTSATSPHTVIGTIDNIEYYDNISPLSHSADSPTTKAKLFNSGLRNGAFDFVSYPSYVEIGAPLTLDELFTDKDAVYTINWWQNMDTLPTLNRPIIVTTDGASATLPTTNGLAVYWSSSTVLNAGTRTSTSGGLWVNGGAFTVPLQYISQWHMFTVVVDGVTDNNTCLYIDGILSSCIADTANTFAAAQAYAPHIGSWGTELSSTGFDGKIDDFSIIGRELTTSEIQQFYNNGESIDIVQVINPTTTSITYPQITKQAGTLEYVNTPSTPTANYTDTFVTDGYVDVDTKISVNTGSQILSINAVSDVSNDATSYNLGNKTIIDDFTIRGKLNISTLDHGSSAVDKRLYIGLFDEDSSSDANNAQDGIFMMYTHDNAVSQIQLRDTDGVTPTGVTADATFAHAPAVETVYFEINRHGLEYYITLYSDSSYSTIVESKRGTVLSTTTNLKYFKVMNDVTFTGAGSIQGSIDDVNYYSGWNGLKSKIAGSLYLDGSTYFTTPVESESKYDCNYNMPCSWSFWIKTISTTDNGVLMKANDGASIGWSVYMTGSTGKVSLDLVNTATSNELSMSTTNAVNNGKWNHVVVTYDGSRTPGGVKIYINGVSETLTTNLNTLSASILNNLNVGIGAESDGGNKLTGMLDDIRVYNTQLTSSDVTRLYNYAISAHTITDNLVVGDNIYKYTAMGVNQNGFGSSSNNATSGQFSSPGIVTNLVVLSNSTTQLNLSWNTPNDGGSPITGYKIERETPVGGGWAALVNTTNSTSTVYYNSGLTSATQYNYRVSAINDVGTGNPSTAVANYTQPNAPTNLNATSAPPTASTLTLSWTAPSGPINGYLIQRESPVGGGFATIVSNYTGGTTYVDIGLAENTQYNYRVAARVNPVGPYSGESNGTTLEYPDPPTSVTATITNPDTDPFNVLVNWTAPADIGSNTVITGYDIQRRIGAGAWTPLINTTGTGTTYNDLSVTQGNTYSYRLRTLGDIINGSTYSTPSNNVTVPTVPTAPISFNVLPKEGNVNMQLSWSAPSSNGGSAISGYWIQRNINSTGWTTIVASQPTLSYIDSGLFSHTTYQYRVAAINGIGNGTFATDTAEFSWALLDVDVTQPGGSTIQFEVNVTMSYGIPDTDVTDVWLRYWSSGNIVDTVDIGLPDTIPKGQSQVFTLYDNPSEYMATDYYIVVRTENGETFQFRDFETDKITAVPGQIFTGHIDGVEVRNSTYTGSILSLNGQPVTFDLVVVYIEQNNPTNRFVYTWSDIVNINYTSPVGNDRDYYVIAYYNPTFSYFVGGSPELGNATIPLGYPIDFSLVSYGDPSAKPFSLGIDVITGDSGIFGLPLVFIFIIALASVFTGRSSPMGIIFVAVAIGVMAYMGMIDFNFDPANQSNLATWAIIIIAVIIGVFIGKRWD